MKQFELPALAAGRWVYESLLEGPSLTLAKMVARSAALDEFRFTTFATDTASDDELMQFSLGGKADSASADKWLFEVLLESAAECPVQLIVEDWRASRGNEFLTTLGFPAVYFGDETYYLLRPKQRPLHPQEARIFSNSVPAFHAFAIEEDSNMSVGTSLSMGDLHRFAKGVKTIVCGAYDGESYVVATRCTCDA